MNAAIRKLIALMLLDVQRLMAALEDGSQTVAQWRQTFEQALARYHTAALLVGQQGAALSDAGRAWLSETVQAQIGFLDRWAVEIQDEAQFRLGWNARAALYAEGIGQSYWRGATRMLPLPAMPRDGTTPCLGNCGCAWDIEQLDGEGNYDCYWRMGALEHCQGCKQRAADWAPYRIRDGRVV